MSIGRRAFTGGLAATLAAAKLGNSVAEAAGIYSGPNIIVVRFGGGVRRLETIDTKGTYAPFLRHTLAGRGTLIPDMHISQINGLDTSHAEGTLNILTGRYLSYAKSREGVHTYLTPQTPTLFESIRKNYVLKPHEVLLINGEDRPQEEYMTYGVHPHYGADYRSEALSLYRYKIYLLRQHLAEGGTDEQMAQVSEDLRKLKEKYKGGLKPQSPVIEKFWEEWRRTYGDSGLKNPRGDRLLTELALRALRTLRPKFMMINYQDPDYVHWGNASHYTRAISVIDEGLKQLVAFTDTDPVYRGRTVYVIVPDCGRDSNPLMGVPFQHHFNTRSAHEIWALMFGPNIEKSVILDKPKEQVDIAPTIAALMGIRMAQSEGSVLSGVLR